ncbi:hypothetical protein DYB32_006351 [Aphanomyces invadans]|uniref:Uncharacterized protein n=1 Tax=Aphanomyces invadans TaxID=157072 RepID=A0A3R7A6Z3_9STRA|nr:hypothetical protein DYB32_006351 [Aphanomyces invadans]
MNVPLLALKKNQTVTRLNLSENQFSTPGMLAIATLLVENAKLEELYLSWNKIRGLGAQRLVEALGYHNSLRVLDLSWNSLNSCPNQSIATALATSLANNKVLVHLDLSNNSLDTKACTILAAALVGNHSIVGCVDPASLLHSHHAHRLDRLHMVGNQAIVDARGFVRPQTTSIALQAQHKHCAIKHFELHQDNQESNNSTTLDAWWPYVDRACWLCGRWSEHRFAWTPSHKQDAKAKVKLHLCIDDWSGDEMHRSSDMFVLYRMLPPGKTKYFITVETEARTHLSPVAPGDVKRQYVVLKDKRTARLLRSHGDEPKFGTLQVLARANTIKVLKWDIKKSVFASRYKESPSKAPVSVALDQVCVSLSGFNEFLDDCHLIDDTSERCTASDMDNVFVAANLEVTDEAKQQDNPDRSLTRFEFLECVFRIAINKYCNSKRKGHELGRSCRHVVAVACESPAQALHRLMDENLTSMVPDDPNDFRTNYLYKEEISDCFLDDVGRLQLKELFAANSGQYCRVGEPRGMAIQEFIALIFHVLNDKFKQRDLRDMFFASKMLLLDEMAPPEVQKKLLFFTDFLELLLRIAIVRYPPASPSVADAAVSLQTLFVRHICAKDKLVETFQHNADKVRVLGALSRFERRPSKKSVVQRKASNKQLQLPVPNQD